MKLREVPLRDILESPRSQRVRDVDGSFVSALAESFRAGSDQQNPIPVYEGGGKYHALGGNHQLAAMKSAFGEDSDRSVVVRILVPRKQEDAILEAAKDNNHRDMTMLEWQAIFALAKARLGTQKAVATFFGVSESFVSKCEHMDSYGPEAQSRRRAGQKNGMTTESPETYTNLPPKGSVTPVPSQPGEAPSAHPEIGVAEVNASNGIHLGARGAGVISNPGPSTSPSNGGMTGPSKSEPDPSPSVHAGPAPPLLSLRAPHSPLPALQKAVEALREALKASEWEEASDATTRAAAQALASADASIFDFRAYREDGRRTKDGPLPRAQVFAFPIMAEVRLKSENGGHRAWVMAHLPGGKVKLRVLRGKEKTEEVHLERNLSLAVGAKA